MILYLILRNKKKIQNSANFLAIYNYGADVAF